MHVHPEAEIQQIATLGQTLGIDTLKMLDADTAWPWAPEVAARRP